MPHGHVPRQLSLKAQALAVAKAPLAQLSFVAQWLQDTWQQQDLWQNDYTLLLNAMRWCSGTAALRARMPQGQSQWIGPAAFYDGFGAKDLE